MVRRLETLSGLPGRFILPVGLANMSLMVAVSGMFWDLGYHTDNGRDTPGIEGALNTPHLLIVAGLWGILGALFLHARMDGPRARGEVSLLDGKLSLAPGAIWALASIGLAGLAFPLDPLWHAMFGVDVTLWSPTHLFMVGGAGASTLGFWMLTRQGCELGRPTWFGRGEQTRQAGALLLGVSTLAAEFDFGMPQAQLLFHPVLLCFASALALVLARSLLGPGGALKALGLFFAVRLFLLVLVGSVLDLTTPVVPLYIVEALLVEAAWVLAARRNLNFPLLAAVGIGTVGLASEWGWSHLVMSHPWKESMLPEAVTFGLLAAVGGSLLGYRIAQAMAGDGLRPSLRPTIRPAVVVAASAALALALLYPLPRTSGDGERASIVPVAAGDGLVNVRVSLEPKDASEAAEWFYVLSWQGHDRHRVTALEKVGPGRFMTEKAVPVGGTWNTLVRLAKGSSLTALPVYQPATPEAGRDAVPVGARAGVLEAETFQLLREARSGGTVEAILAYGVILALVAAWLLTCRWSLSLYEHGRSGTRTAAPAGVGRLGAA